MVSMELKPITGFRTLAHNKIQGQSPWLGFTWSTPASCAYLYDKSGQGFNVQKLCALCI